MSSPPGGGHRRTKRRSGEAGSGTSTTTTSSSSSSGHLATTPRAGALFAVVVVVAVVATAVLLLDARMRPGGESLTHDEPLAGATAARPLDVPPVFRARDIDHPAIVPTLRMLPAAPTTAGSVEVARPAHRSQYVAQRTTPLPPLEPPPTAMTSAAGSLDVAPPTSDNRFPAGFALWGVGATPRPSSPRNTGGGPSRPSRSRPPREQQQPVWAGAQPAAPPRLAEEPPAGALSGPSTSDVLVFVHCPKTGGSSFYNAARWVSQKHKFQWYPGGSGGSASFKDTGCGEVIGSAHCDVAEVDACLTLRYHGRRLPVPAMPAGGRLLFVTVLRHPVKRVLSELSFACVSKKRSGKKGKSKRGRKGLINTPQGARVLLDWSVALWDLLDVRMQGEQLACLAPPPATFHTWLHHPDNPAHARFARFLLRRAPEEDPNLGRAHQCFAGDQRGTLAHWDKVLAHRGAAAPGQVRTMQALAQALNESPRLRAAAEETITNHFFFVAVLEKLEDSINAFCRLLERPSNCRSRPPVNEGAQHQSSVWKLTPSPEQLRTVETFNTLDMRLYDLAVLRLQQHTRPP